MVLRETPSSVAMEATVFSGRVSRSRAWRVCSGVIGGPAEAGAAGAGGGKALVGSFDDELADELGQGGKDMEDQPSPVGGGVEGFVQRGEADAAPAQAGHDGDEVLDGAAQAVQGGDGEGVPGAQVVQGLG